MCAKSFESCPIQLFATLWTVAHQAPLSMGFSRQEYWNGLPCPPPGHLPHQGLTLCFLRLLHWQEGSLTLVPPGMPLTCVDQCKSLGTDIKEVNYQLLYGYYLEIHMCLAPITTWWNFTIRSVHVIFTRTNVISIAFPFWGQRNRNREISQLAPVKQLSPPRLGRKLSVSQADMWNIKHAP